MTKVVEALSLLSGGFKKKKIVDKIGFVGNFITQNKQLFMAGWASFLIYTGNVLKF